MVSTASYSDPSPEMQTARLKSRSAKSRSYKDRMKSKNAEESLLTQRDLAKVPH